MRFPVLGRQEVVLRLTNEQGRPIVVTPLLGHLLTHIDDPALFEFLLKVVRQVGKSTACGAIAITELVCVANSYTVLVSASEGQQRAIFDRKIRRPLERFARELGIADEFRFTQSSVDLPALNSGLVVLASNEATVPGRTATLLIVDEARDVADAVFVALAPSVIGAGGKIIIGSSAGRPRGFFHELQQHPGPHTSLYESAENTNPYARRSLIEFLRQRLALVSPAAARRDLGNETLDDGDELIPAALIEAAVDDRLGEVPFTDRPAFAFLDLSRKRDLTSLVVVVREAARRPEAADHLIAASVQTWDPSQSPSGETDFAEVRAALDRLPARFPGLEALGIDEGAEAGTVLPFCRQHPRLSLLVRSFVASVTSNMDLWGALSARLHAGTLAIPRVDRLVAELRGLRREEFAFGSRWRVVDAGRRLHRDVSLALAGAVMLAGAARRCPVAGCDFENCGGPADPPWMLLGTPESRRWDALHFGGEEPLAVPPPAAVPAPPREAMNTTFLSQRERAREGGQLERWVSRVGSWFPNDW